MARVLVVAALILFACCKVSSAEYKADTIYVHLVPHTHDDVGWLKTVDEYYYGANNSIQHAAVQYILDTVVEELWKNENRTFIYVEIAYFMRWWRQQTDATKEKVRTLVHRKQLEFVNAGWCMNDEASTHYNAIIDQMTLGLQFVEMNFGQEARPRVAWHIDPFGHSAEQAALFALMGYDAFFFARIDYDDKKQRTNHSTLEMVWSPSNSLGATAEIFTGVLFYGYGPPPGFCFDVRCSDQPIQDDPRLFDYNVNERVEDFARAVITQAAHYATNHIMFTMGSDFQYEDALEVFKNLDKLIYYVNQQSEKYHIEAMYSTPSRYIDAVHDANKTWTVKYDDFFPYADNPYAYWTGYFTSRPALKGYTRTSNSLLQTCKQLEVVGAALPRKTQASSVTLQQAMGVDQHHDAVSGTEKQHVADDYAKRLHMGQVECQDVINEIAGEYISQKSQSSPLNFQFCEYLNISVCPASETDSFNVVAYNPLDTETGEVFYFPVHSEQFTVMDDNGKTIMSQINPVPNATKDQVRRKRGNAPYEIFWLAPLPPLGMRTFFVRPSQKPKVNKAEEHVPRKQEDIVIEYPGIAVTFNGTTGRVVSILNKISNQKVIVDQQFLWWNSSDGRNVNSTQKSGAYIFRPNGTAPFEVNKGNVATISVVRGPVVTEVRQVFSPWASQIVRIFNFTNIVQFAYTIGPIPFQDDLGKEVVSRFSTDLATDGTWYTDANGREMQKRVRNFRPTWKYNNTEPVAGNYYPVNSRIYIRDESKNVQFTVMTDRSQGGSSLNDGQVELMVHRRTLYDDSRGVGEPINETGQFGDGLIITGSHIVLFDSIPNSTFQRYLGLYLLLRPVFAIQPSNETYSNYVQKYYTNFTGLTRDLYLSIHLLTLQQLNKNHVLVRLENPFEFSERNATVKVELDTLFTTFKVTEAEELTLGGNAPLSSVHRLHWLTGSRDSSYLPSKPVKGPKFTVELKPMEIRTFNVTVDYY